VLRRAFALFFSVCKTWFCDRENLAFARPLFLLAVGFCMDVVLPALTIAKPIRDVGSFPLPLTFGRFHD
jgi:hypothetical protein